ncbi:MAG: hypothetical protein FD166_3503 [Bacteroidetes bacterium]|nr:MAG: hypothetical protein FD166_3503 [Bacteroidota bacterium]
MWFRTVSLLFIVSTAASGISFAQGNDTVKDSTRLYKNIETLSGGSRFTRFMYKMVFRPTSQHSVRKHKKKPIQQPYSSFEGKTIRHIHIITLDPFGNSIEDTISATGNYFTRAGNRLHIRTQQVTIRNLLLIRQNQVFESFLVKESERLVRTRKYVTDVSFYVRATSKDSDSVDIYIRELDKWSIIPGVVTTDTRVTVYLTDRNFLGLGHESRNGFTWHHNTGDFNSNTNYYIPNIRNTYINTTLHYGTDEFHNFAGSFGIDRPFFSPVARWAAGVNYSQQYRKVYNDKVDSADLADKFRFTVQDYWAGHSFQIFKGKSEDNRSTNFITAIRYLKICYPGKPGVFSDTQQLFSNEDFLLAGIGFSKRKYTQDRFIFKHGITEDVPVGKVYSITAGLQQRDLTRRIYFGSRASFGKYYPWGYLSTNFEFGTFFRAAHVEQGVFTAGIIYFSGLKEIGKWKFRQFIKPQLTIGINRYATDSITLNDGVGLDGFNSDELTGISRMIFTFQTQSYSPWNFIGFRFGPYISCTIGMLGNKTSGFRNSRVYSQIGFGLLIKNPNLVINNFQISVAYYPDIPGKGNHVFKFNSLETADFEFRDFESGKPSIVAFQ